MPDQHGSRRNAGALDSRSAYRFQFGRELQARVGHELRDMHADIMSAGLPAEFQDALSRLDKAAGNRSGD